MSYSVVQLCNLALSRIGISQSITSLSEASTKAQLCNLHYDAARDAVLEAFPWPFATVTASLALVTVAPSTDWKYAFRAPSDCVKALRTLDAGRGSSSPFAVGADAIGQLVLFDGDTVSLQYIQRVTDTGRFPASFGHALAWRLASELAAPLAVSSSFMQAADAGYRKTLGEAETQAINQSWPDTTRTSSLESARL